MMLSDKHMQALWRAGNMWSVEETARGGHGLIAVTLPEGGTVFLPPSVAYAIGVAMTTVAVDMMKRDD